jgi:hypothetical protein
MRDNLPGGGYIGPPGASLRAGDTRSLSRKSGELSLLGIHHFNGEVAEHVHLAP